MDDELVLFDRLEVIRTANSKYDIEGKAYLSFSGGKDSTILHHLLDMALPGNRIPRVFIDTGIEYQAIREFVMDLASKDERFVILKPSKPIMKMLAENGYPFKSKEHSVKIGMWQKGSRSPSIVKYRENPSFGCPKALAYQFEGWDAFKVSDACCREMKKKPIAKWSKQNDRSITITGMRKEEGGQRANLKGCILTDKNGKLKKFHPLLVVTDEWENWFVERERESNCANSTIPHSTSKGRDARDARSPSTYRSNSLSCRSTCRTKGRNAKSYGSPYTKNIGA